MSDLSTPQRAPARRSWRATLLAGAAALVVFGIEQLVPTGWPRAAVASVGFLSVGLGAAVLTLRAAATTPGRARLTWIFVALAG